MADLDLGICPECDEDPMERRGYDDEGDPCTHPCHDVAKNLSEREEIRTMIEAAPYPMEGKPIWERCQPATMEEILAPGYTGPTGEQKEAYEWAAGSLAHAMLICADENPLLAAEGEALFAAACERFPGLNEWLGGVSGAQYGWAVGAVKVAHGREDLS